MLAIVDYKAGNLTSVRLAFEAAGIDAVTTDSPRVIREADHVVFPGVGAAASAMRTLRELGLHEAIPEAIARGTPFLGICLGTQIVLSRTEEDNGVSTLGLIEGEVRRFQPSDPLTKVPHMGWNSVEQVRPHPLFEGIEDRTEFYFVHGYYPHPARRETVLGVTEYANARFASVVGRANLAATQFHPEKSGRVGLRLLGNFARWDGTF